MTQSQKSNTRTGVAFFCVMRRAVILRKKRMFVENSYNTMGMEIITSKISKQERINMAQHFFGDMVKGVVDVERQTLALDAELHADLETLLLENASQQEHLWGINLYPDIESDDFLEFDSLINIRPAQNNRSRSVENVAIQNHQSINQSIN
jgi:hypothetical protein